MSDVIVRYKVKEGRGDENQALVEAVFAELAAGKPAGLRYGTFRLEDGVTFIHVARIEGAENPLTSTEAFAAFTADLPDRCGEPPQPMGATVVGSYGLLAD